MLARFVNFFWLWTFLGTGWAWIVPEHFTWFLGEIPGTNLKWVPLGLAIIMLGMGMTLTFADSRRCVDQRRRNRRYRDVVRGTWP